MGAAVIQDLQGILVPREGENLIMSPVPQSRMPNAWEFLETQLEQKPLIEDVGFTKQFFYNQLSAGNMQLWVVGNQQEVLMSLITRVLCYPLWNALEVFWGRGKRINECMPYIITSLEAYARQYNCTHVNIQGRKGWEKPLAKLGFKLDYSVFSLDITKKIWN